MKRIIIMGCGRVGALLANLLSKAGYEVVVIDQNGEAFERLGDDFNGQIVTGDGTDEDILERAGLKGAYAFAAVTNGDNRNIMAAQIAKHIFGIQNVVCRIYDPIRQETYNDLGLQSISPTKVGAKLMMKELTDPVVPGRSATRSLAAGTSVPTPPPPPTRSAPATPASATASRRS
ncbi:MAG: TrkA family potassium uptake protein [Ktedonobacterales bacterium]